MSATARWDTEGLWQQLLPVLPDVSIEVHAQLESTNTELIERARKLAGRLDAPVSLPGELDAGRRGDNAGGPWGRRAVDTHPSLLVAEHQTLGRGRMGRDWMAQPGASLTFSIGLPMQPAHWGGLSLAVGVALAAALDPRDPLTTAAPRIGLKWPNDLWLIDPQAANGVGRKLAGILIETVPVGAQRMVVVGVGLNILPWGSDEAALGNGYASWSEIHPEASAPAALHRLALPLAQALREFEATGLHSFMASFAQRDLLAGRTVSLSRPASASHAAPTPVQAEVVGISTQGALRVREDNAGVKHISEVHSADVSVRIADAQQPSNPSQDF
jgi:BirA family transcriptional regulator, biotin operon repressor / biotin---[acetyl-CoA-carboxylase] ligase